MDEPAASWPAPPVDGITVEIEYAPDEYGRVITGVIFRKWTTWALLAVLALLPLTVRWDELAAGEWWWWLEGPALALLVGVLYGLLTYNIGKSTQRTMPMLAGPLIMTFGPDRMWMSARGMRQELHYSALYGAEETRDHILLMISNTTRYVVPKRAIPNPQALATLRQSINQGLPGKAKRRLKT